MTFLRIVIPLYLFFEHDLFGKPVPTFPDHARGHVIPPRQILINRKSTACRSMTLPFRPSCKFSTAFRASSPRPRRTARRRTFNPTCCSARGFFPTCCRCREIGRAHV